MEEDYQRALEPIFVYGYRCCVFKHSLCSGLPGIPDGMLDSAHPLPTKFFVNPRCPLAPTTFEAKAIEVDIGEAVKDLVQDVVAEEHGRLLSLC